MTTIKKDGLLNSQTQREGDMPCLRELHRGATGSAERYLCRGEAFG